MFTGSRDWLTRSGGFRAHCTLGSGRMRYRDDRIHVGPTCGDIFACSARQTWKLSKQISKLPFISLLVTIAQVLHEHKQNTTDR